MLHSDRRRARKGRVGPAETEKKNFIPRLPSDFFLDIYFFNPYTLETRSDVNDFVAKENLKSKGRMERWQLRKQPQKRNRRRRKVSSRIASSGSTGGTRFRPPFCFGSHGERSSRRGFVIPIASGCGLELMKSPRRKKRPSWLPTASLVQAEGLQEGFDIGFVNEDVAQLFRRAAFIECTE